MIKDINIHEALNGSKFLKHVPYPYQIRVRGVLIKYWRIYRAEQNNVAKELNLTSDKRSENLQLKELLEEAIFKNLPEKYQKEIINQL